MAPMRDAAEGSAARPGKRVTMASATEINDKLAAQMANLDLSLKVLSHLEFCSPAPVLTCRTGADGL